VALCRVTGLLFHLLQHTDPTARQPLGGHILPEDPAVLTGCKLGTDRVHQCQLLFIAKSLLAQRPVLGQKIKQLAKYQRDSIQHLIVWNGGRDREGLNQRVQALVKIVNGVWGCHGKPEEERRKNVANLTLNSLRQKLPQGGENGLVNSLFTLFPVKHGSFIYLRALQYPFN